MNRITVADVRAVLGKLRMHFGLQWEDLEERRNKAISVELGNRRVALLIWPGRLGNPQGNGCLSSH